MRASFLLFFSLLQRQSLFVIVRVKSRLVRARLSLRIRGYSYIASSYTDLMTVVKCFSFFKMLFAEHIFIFHAAFSIVCVKSIHYI